MISEFKEFAMKGNVVDLAVGVVIGAAFGKIVSSLVDDIIMPPIAVMTGGIDFSAKKMVLIAADATTSTAEVAVRYGAFIQTVIQFIIVAFVIFMAIKAMNSARKEEVAAPSPPPGPTTDQKLLTEIRDLLRKG